MGCSSQRDVQTNEIKKFGEEEHLQISINPELIEEFQPKIEEQEEMDKPEENLEEIYDKIQPEIEIKKGDEKFEEENPEDLEIESDEYQTILLGGAPPETMERFNPKENDGINKRKNIYVKRKKPFVVSAIEDSSFPRIKIIINANTFREEYTMPIWCPKNSFIKFRVKGKWRISKLYAYTDSKGLPSNNHGGFGYGALVGRIGKGDRFVVSDERAIEVKEEGGLSLKQILPKNMKVEPEGKLEVIVYDGQYMDIEEINKKIGWIENNTIGNEENNQEGEIITKKEMEEKEKKDFEKKLRNNLNNLRMNPLTFYQIYISKSKKLTQTMKILEKFDNQHLPALNSNDDYYEAVMDYFKLFDRYINEKNSNKNNIVDYITNLEEELAYYLSDKFSNNVKVKCKLTQKNKPLDVIINCFFDKKYRFYIFNKRSRDLTINIIKNYFKDFNLVIMAFTFEENSG